MLAPILAMGVSVGSPGPSRADDELLPATPLTRKFPQGQFCALPLTLAFRANGPMATIHFVANVFTDDGSPTLVWTQQFIDNVVVATAEDYAANFGPPPPSSNSEFCYIGDPEPTPYFYFNRAGLVLPLKELFDTDPAGRGWDLSAGAYWNETNTGPRNPEADDDYTGGSLGLGLDSPNPSLADRAATSITVGGLVAGSDYNVSAWWDVGNVVLNGATYLTVRVTGPSATPLAQRSWGFVKSRYR
jgi:hypothetical protein